jgi:hypothetical protein
MRICCPLSLFSHSRLWDSSVKHREWYRQLNSRSFSQNECDISPKSVDSPEMKGLTLVDGIFLAEVKDSLAGTVFGGCISPPLPEQNYDYGG